MALYSVFGKIIFMRFFAILWAAMLLAAPSHVREIGGPALVHDGDTIRIGTQSVRIWGIDAVELKQKCGDVACGVMAREALKEIIADRPVDCTAKGKSYQRIVALCRVGGHDIAQSMIRIGMAFDYRQYSHGFYARDEAAARQSRAGVWAMAEVQNPAEWRKCKRSGCITPSAFTERYRIVPDAKIALFEAASTLPYTPRVKAKGLRAVNKAVNAMAYVQDWQRDQMLDPDLFWRQGGDCDKHALIKMLELRAQGITDVYYLVLTRGDTAHAVLVAEDKGVMLSLDNRSDALIPLALLYKEFRPAYFINARTHAVWQARTYIPNPVS